FVVESRGGVIQCSDQGAGGGVEHICRTGIRRPRVVPGGPDDDNVPRHCHGNAEIIAVPRGGVVQRGDQGAGGGVEHIRRPGIRRPRVVLGGPDDDGVARYRNGNGEIVVEGRGGVVQRGDQGAAGGVEHVRRPGILRPRVV